MNEVIAERIKYSALRTIIATVALAAAGCSADQPLNPSFPITVRQAKLDLQGMRREPKQLARPVVVLAASDTACGIRG